MLLATSAAAPASAAVSGFPEPAVHATPLGDPANWVRPEDYPAAPLAADKEGVTGFALDIDSAGRVDQCSIWLSSGSQELDQTTCRVIMERALFSPAKDAQGQAMPGRYRSRIKWVIPKKPLPQAGMLRVAYVLQPDGSLTDCSWEAEGGFQENMTKAKVQPKACPNNQAFADVYTDEQGRPVARRVVNTTRIEVLPLEEASASPEKAVGQAKPVSGRER